METLKKVKSIVLQVGESVHTHVLESETDILVEEGDQGDIHFMLEGTGILRHEEHGRMVFQPGNYFKYPQVEFDPMENNVRAVFD